ncbi:MAG TPA: zincin-like metallopeptidase domain-containing protein [Sedimentisphaerales bacterium]
MNTNNKTTAKLTNRIAITIKEGGNGKRQTVYEQITERIIAMLEKGTVPWRKPWNVQTGLPRNLVTKKGYRGINIFLLHAMSYESAYWLTFRQAQQLGGTVRKGEKACPVVFWKQLEVEDKESHEIEKIPMLRFYYVFNTAQVDGLKNIPATVETPATVSMTAEEIVALMPKRPEIKHGLAKAFYSPSVDVVAMPDRARFDTEAGYFATLFHELTHASGHKSRLNRQTLTESAGFGSNPYCREELIAEMGAAFLCGQAGIAENILENSAAYVQNWLEQLQNDKKLIVQAAAQAQKAADFILGTKFNEAIAG